MPARDVFLCHASPDKETYVRPLSYALARRGVSCWVDEAVLHAGDSIIDAISVGLTTSKYIVVIITSTFGGRRWPRKELNAALTREIREGSIVVLPVVAIAHDEFSRQFPLLADKVYLAWSDGPERIADRIAGRIGRIPASEWFYMHEQAYTGPVWTRVTPTAAASETHRMRVRWRHFMKDIESPMSGPTSFVHHKTHPDEMPIYVTVDPPAIVTFGDGPPPDERVVNIDEGWTRIAGSVFGAAD